MKIFKKDTPFYKSEGFIKCIASILCVIASILICLIVLFILDASNGCENVISEFNVMLSGGLTYSGSQGFFDILNKTAPLLCCGLAICFAYKTGMFNIGAAGQYVLGMFGGLVFALKFNCHWSVCLIMATLFGTLWGAIPGILKALFNVSEVIGGIMLNWIGLFFVNYSWQTYLRDCLDGTKGYKTYSILSSNAHIPNITFSNGNTLSITIIFALIVCVLVWFIMKHTTLGFELKASGLNKEATRYAGMNEKRNIILAMAISGALAGLGGGLYYLSGISQWEGTASTALPGVPWNGIVVAFIGQINPIGTAVASFFISFISEGANFMTQSIFPTEVADLITGIIVYLSGLSTFIVGLIMTRSKNKRIEEMMLRLKEHHEKIMQSIKERHDRFKEKFKKNKDEDVSLEDTGKINLDEENLDVKKDIDDIDLIKSNEKEEK